MPFRTETSHDISNALAMLNAGSRPGRCEILQAKGELFAMSQRSILFGWWPFDGWFIWRLVQAQIKPCFQYGSIVSLFGVHVYLVSWWGFVERSMMVHDGATLQALAGRIENFVPVSFKRCKLGLGWRSKAYLRSSRELIGSGNKSWHLEPELARSTVTCCLIKNS